MVVENKVIPLYPESPCLTSSLHLADTSVSYGDSVLPIGNYTAIMKSGRGGTLATNLGVQPDIWLTNLFLYFMNQSSSVALQSIITTLAGVEYYSRLQQYDKSANVSQAFFVNAITPGGPIGPEARHSTVGLHRSHGGIGLSYDPHHHRHDEVRGTDGRLANRR